MAKKHVWDWQEALTEKNKRMRSPFLTLEQLENQHIQAVLTAYGHNMAHAAKALGVSRSTLYRKLERTQKLATKKSRKKR
jgi:transcriptional regulator with PAS, ATPase and Fis domain